MQEEAKGVQTQGYETLPKPPVSILQVWDRICWQLHRMNKNESVESSLIMMIISTGGVLPAPDGPPVRHVSHYGDAPSPAVCQVFLPTYYFTFDFNFHFDFHFTFHSLCRRAASTTRPRCCRRATTSPPHPSTTTATSSPPPTTTTRSALNLHIYICHIGHLAGHLGHLILLLQLPGQY